MSMVIAMIAMISLLPMETSEATRLFWILAGACLALVILAFIGLRFLRVEGLTPLGCSWMLGAAGGLIAVLLTRKTDMHPNVKVILPLAVLAGPFVLLMLTLTAHRIGAYLWKRPGLSRATTVKELLPYFGHYVLPLERAAKKRLHRLKPTCRAVARTMRKILDGKLEQVEKQDASQILAEYLKSRGEEARDPLADLYRWIDPDKWKKVHKAVSEALIEVVRRDDFDLLAELAEEAVEKERAVDPIMKKLLEWDREEAAGLTMRAFERGCLDVKSLKPLGAAGIYEALERAIAFPDFATYSVFRNGPIVRVAANFPPALAFPLLTRALKDTREMFMEDLLAGAEKLLSKDLSEARTEAEAFREALADQLDQIGYVRRKAEEILAKFPSL
jgi:hypothetical protein